MYYIDPAGVFGTLSHADLQRLKYGIKSYYGRDYHSDYDDEPTVEEDWVVTDLKYKEIK